jgi:hypothetical protein
VKVSFQKKKNGQVYQMPKNIWLTFARMSECFVSKENKKWPNVPNDQKHMANLRKKKRRLH